jgi:DNA-binding transcriptional regulator YhcF (GntR family)
MSIDIYRRNDTKNRLFGISEDLYEILSKAVLNEFERRTGVFIDEYGKSRLTYQHAAILLFLLKESIINNKISPKPLTEIMRFLEQMIETETDVDLHGD